MTISGQNDSALLESVLSAGSTRTEMSMAVLDKSQEILKQQGAALVELIDQAGISPDGLHIDTYA